MEIESQIRISSIFDKKYESLKLLGEGNYGKAILVRSLKDNVIIIFLFILINNI
jgi:hypothetical protein